MNMKEDKLIPSPLHLASCLTGLMDKANVTIVHSIKLPDCLTRMKKMTKLAMVSQKNRDQEQEFIYLHRYLLLVGAASKIPGHKGSIKYKEERENAKNNLERYRELQNILEERYKELLNSSKKQSETNKPDNNETINKSTTKHNVSEVSTRKFQENSNRLSIPCSELYNIIKDKNANISMLLLDSRKSEDFDKSRIKFHNIINVPEHLIEKGLSASQLGKKLLPASQDLWNKRRTFDLLIMFDWNSTEVTLEGSKLFLLRETMIKWDPNPYKCVPLILEGGYEEILNLYPYITTNPKVEIPSQSNSLIKNILESLVYPMEDLEPKLIKPPPQIEMPKPASPVLTIDRSTKPKIALPIPKENSQENVEVETVMEIDQVGPFEEKVDAVEEIEEVLSNEPEETPMPPSEPQLQRSTKTVVNDNLLHKHSLEELRRKKPSRSSVPAKLSSEEELNNAGVERTPLKGDSTTASNLKRASSSPNIAQLNEDMKIQPPNYTRTNKPRPHIHGERTDATYGKTAVGLTGLKNFANNCYMNSIMQCLSNTEALKKELINLNCPAMNPGSKTKGEVAQEVITALRYMWSGDIKVYSIKDLKVLMGNLKDIFKGTSHQDSNEFLIILLEYLHEDLNISSSVHTYLDGADEGTGEKAWGEFRKKNSSVIQRLFYGQQKSTIMCSSCDHYSVTFEPFFNLFVPIPATQDRVTLNDCIKMYMSGERISGWKCPKCQAERNAIKKFDISKLPPILVIALKRFTQEDDSWLHKKENVVMYPLDSLDMEPFIVINSEQRYTHYNLYAVSTHSGTLHAGHYKAMCKNSITGKWYMFDDQTIEPLASHSVQNNPEAYILFYSSVK